jgi:hypothetical protein
MATSLVGHLWELDLRHLVFPVHNLMLLKNPATHLGERVGVDVVAVAHMRVLLRPLFEASVAAKHRTPERLFSGMDSDVVFEGGRGLAFAATPLASVNLVLDQVLGLDGAESALEDVRGSWLMVVVGLYELGAGFCHLLKFKIK